ncbi:hypothetical protein FNO01nite_34090 [Flavobacterium noncentrifugens]|uniref:Intein N-terminal splicing region n=1 Tax=Flavobacterium noncentrifugens TaxID=1128970 RepID=A0A1G9DC31_9FLAO|nr:hypothetical protein [Flavobacterium noncentrifugens]GEP52737.1 hypothetical protein FNO01nite_34090 [Flavobacterium noncentrifugens]SDK61364.1 intein N-terminal splicing region [Flavobacterium noncentrifugens]
MEPELLNKFNKIIHYNSEYNDRNSGLRNVTLQTFFEVETTGVIRMDIWIATSDFFEGKNSKPDIEYRHQTVFELRNAERLSETELLKMFRFTEKEFLDTEIVFENDKSQKIKDLYKLENKISDEGIIETIKDGPNFILKLWK